MKQNYFFLLFVICLGLNTISLQAQVLVTTDNPRSQEERIQMGVSLTPGDHVSEEVIIRFDVAPTSRRAVTSDLKDQSIYVQEWSPSGKFLRAVAPKLESCDYDGVGNPNSGTVGGGDQISLNYYANTRGWRNLDRFYFQCVSPRISSAPVIGQDGNITYPYDYNPAFECSDDVNLIPRTGEQKVKMVIIDSGLKSLPGQGVRNGVAYQQTIIPTNCSISRCEPILNNIEEYSDDFHPHGSYIFELISNWFDSEGLASQLSVSSYKVLDEDLKTTIFQVIKAIELATMEKVKPQVISLSLGFRPLKCGNSSDPIAGPRDDYGLDPDLGPTDEPQIRVKHSPLYYAIKDAEEQNIIVVTSAGNDGRSLDATPQYPAAETGLNNLVTVGSLQCGNGMRSEWSNYSDNYVDLFAPGSKVKSISGSCYISISGTSFSCPIVAAKAAFHVTAQEVYNDDDVLCLLRSQVTPLAGAKYGMVNVVGSPEYCDKGGKRLIGKSRSVETSTTISPNPFANQLTIGQLLTPSGSSTVLTLFDGQGREVIRRETKELTTTLDVQDLIPGVYWLSIRSASGVETRKVIKQ
ncbi:S8/S53 family peptidase [Neolewinella persica]|uniref:S8/S53 family peptidase n=1 Tax=Neolewinella persica TaxID=70998 RepID=UPI00146A94DC|nr:S8/S53 family peptidase [Neolewinella persica]